MPSGLATPMTPSVLSPIRSGTKYHGTIGNVPVSAPAGSPWLKAQRAAVIGAASSASSGGQAAIKSRSPSCSSSTTTARPRLAWISLAAPSATASNDARPDRRRVNS